MLREQRLVTVNKVRAALGYPTLDDPVDDDADFDPIGMAGDADDAAASDQAAATEPTPTCDADALTAVAQHAYARDALESTDWATDHYAVMYGHLSAARDRRTRGRHRLACHLRLLARRYYAVGDGLLAAGDDAAAAYYIGIADTTRSLADAVAWSAVSGALHAIGATP